MPHLVADIVKRFAPFRSHHLAARWAGRTASGCADQRSAREAEGTESADTTTRPQQKKDNLPTAVEFQNVESLKEVRQTNCITTLLPTSYHLLRTTDRQPPPRGKGKDRQRHGAGDDHTENDGCSLASRGNVQRYPTHPRRASTGPARGPAHGWGLDKSSVEPNGVASQA